MAEVRPIDANALIARYTEIKEKPDIGLVDALFLDGAMAVVDGAPTLDYAPVRHGEWTTIVTTHWRWKPDGAHPANRFKFEHTECGKTVAKKEPYCPRCGAKMDGGESDD